MRNFLLKKLANIEITKYESDISNSENPKYEQIFSGTVYEKVKIARIIRENLKI